VLNIVVAILVLSLFRLPLLLPSSLRLSLFLLLVLLENSLPKYPAFLLLFQGLAKECWQGPSTAAPAGMLGGTCTTTRLPDVCTATPGVTTGAPRVAPAKRQAVGVML